MKIIRYRISDDITVQFQDEYKYEVDTTYQNFKRKCIRNPYSRTVCGVGYLGVGKHLAHIGVKNTTMYEVWKSMLLRCYSEKDRHLHPTYENCIVAEEWHCFQTFGDWYQSNFYQVGTERMHIDKDILIDNNNIYDPDRCLIVPQRINMIFMKKSRKIDSDLPNGINRCSTGFQVDYNGKSMGVFKTLEKAIVAHDTQKRIHIRNITESYKDEIPLKVYDALLAW